MAFNEKLNKILEETQKKKPFNYDIVIIKNNEFKNQNTLLQINSRHYQWRKKMHTYDGGMQFKTLSKKILGKSTKSMRGMKGCTYKGFFRWKKVMPSFEYELLVLFP